MNRTNGSDLSEKCKATIFFGFVFVIICCWLLTYLGTVEIDSVSILNRIHVVELIGRRRRYVESA